MRVPRIQTVVAVYVWPVHGRPEEGDGEQHDKQCDGAEEAGDMRGASISIDCVFDFQFIDLIDSTYFDLYDFCCSKMTMFILPNDNIV